MISSKTKSGVQRSQTFVLANGQLFKAGSQRMHDSFAGYRAEPALSGSAIKLWTAQVTDDGIAFGRATAAVFDAQGQVRADVRHWALLAALDGLDVTTYVKQKLPQDELVTRFLEIAAQVFGQQELEALALTAKTLPTR